METDAIIKIVYRMRKYQKKMAKKRKKAADKKKADAAKKKGGKYGTSRTSVKTVKPAAAPTPSTASASKTMPSSSSTPLAKAVTITPNKPSGEALKGASFEESNLEEVSAVEAALLAQQQDDQGNTENDAHKDTMISEDLNR